MVNVNVRLNNRQPVEACMLIGGEKVGGNRQTEVRNPVRPDEVVGTIVRGTSEDVNRAVAAAKAAQLAWTNQSFTARANRRVISRSTVPTYMVWRA